MKSIKSERIRVLIVGTLPSTVGVGGVTIHVSRLLKALLKTEVDPVLCDYKRLSLISQVKMVRSCDIVHLHVSNPYLRFFYVTLCKILHRKCVLTFHGNLGRFKGLKNRFDNLALRMCDVPVLINDSSYQTAISINPRAVKISAYIPDDAATELPDEIKQVIVKHKEIGQTIICTNASGMNYDDYGREIYGIHFLIDFINRCKEFFLIVSDPSGEYSKEFGETYENITFITEPHSFASLLKHSDIMIRATSTDGDALSVREALDAGVKVLATDCVDRPQGVILFKYGEDTSLEKALLVSESPMIVVNEPCAVKEICRVYRSLCDE